MPSYKRKRDFCAVGQLANQNDNSISNYVTVHKPARKVRVGDLIRAGAVTNRAYNMTTHDGVSILAGVGIVLDDGNNEYDPLIDPANEKVLVERSEALVITKGDVWVVASTTVGSALRPGNRVFWDGEEFNNASGFLLHNSSFVTGTKTFGVDNRVLLRLGTPTSHQP